MNVILPWGPLLAGLVGLALGAAGAGLGWWRASVRAARERRNLRNTVAAGERSRRLVEDSFGLICLHDLEGRVLWTNPAVAENLGRPGAYLAGVRLADLVPPAYSGEVGAYLARIREHGSDAGLMTVLTGAGGHRVWLYRNRLMEGDPPYVLGHATDVTDLKEMERQLRQREALLRVFVEHTPAAMAMLDRDLRYLAASERWKRNFGLVGQDLVGRHHYEVFPDLPEHWKQIHRRALAGTASHVDEEPFPRADGSLEWVRGEAQPWPDADGAVGGIVLFSELVTEQKQMREALQHMAHHDALTGLLNRHAFGERLERSWNRTRLDPAYRFALLFLDIDGFKGVNDRHGHAVGDEVLREVTRRVQLGLRPKDVVGRLGGDELVALLEDVGSDDALLEEVPRRLTERLAVPYATTAGLVAATVSIGLATSDGAASPEDLLHQADVAMYTAKGEPRGVRRPGKDRLSAGRRLKGSHSPTA